jgi:KUP system potassium uptake protein
MLNYFGQGALLLDDPTAAKNPFFALVPGWALYPMVGVATVAAVVASQALISGAFSLTRQAVQLGYSPRVTVRHTSHQEAGQIYVPEVNAALMVACVGLVLGFRSASNLAAAYGIAVTGTMTITTMLFAWVARVRWHWGLGRVLLVSSALLLVDLAFFGANLVKVAEGGWFPLVVAIVIFALMTTWKRGRVMLATIMRESSLPLDFFLRDIARKQPFRVPGCAVFMTSDPTGAPPVLLHHLKHNKVLHEKVVLMSVATQEIPQVPEDERSEFKELGEGFYLVQAYYGFMETPDVPSVLKSLHGLGLDIKPMDTTFYLGRETLIAVTRPRRKAGVDAPSPVTAGSERMYQWRKKLFILMTRNAQSATAFFNLPPNRVVELGAQIQI